MENRKTTTPAFEYDFMGKIIKDEEKSVANDDDDGAVDEAGDWDDDGGNSDNETKAKQYKCHSMTLGV